jgi:hypothetical protein
MALAVSRSPFGVIFHAFGQSGAYVEVANLRGPDSSYLRIFCQNGSSEPLFAFITDHRGDVAEAIQHVRNVERPSCRH